MERFASICNLERGAGTAVHSREPSIDWEKMGGDPFPLGHWQRELERIELPGRSRDVSGPS